MHCVILFIILLILSYNKSTKALWFHLQIHCDIEHGSNPLILGGDLKISDHNNWGGPEQTIKLGGGAEFKGDLKF